MSTELEKALAKAKYSALPLPRTKAEPTTIFAFNEGQLHVVRNAHTCLPDPPHNVTPDPAVDTLTFTKEFKFDFKGIVGFVLKLLGAGSAKAELSAKSVRSATVVLGGLEHHTVETGALIDYLLKQDDTDTCMRDILDKDHFTIVAALQVKSLTYTFKNEKGATINFTGPEANGMFKVDASVEVSVTEEGKVVVNAPCFVGVITWDGKKVSRELEKARQHSKKKAIAPFRAADAIGNALDPTEVRARQVASMKRAMTVASVKKRKRPQRRR